MSTLIDTGPHTVRVHVEELFTDSRGNQVRRPAAEPVTVTGCQMSPVSSSRGAFPAIDVAAGQTVDATWRLMARDAPLGWWSLVEWVRPGLPDLRLTVLGGPLVHQVSDGTRHVSATLMEER